MSETERWVCVKKSHIASEKDSYINKSTHMINADVHRGPQACRQRHHVTEQAEGQQCVSSGQGDSVERHLGQNLVLLPAHLHC